MNRCLEKARRTAKAGAGSSRKGSPHVRLTDEFDLYAVWDQARLVTEIE